MSSDNTLISNIDLESWNSRWLGVRPSLCEVDIEVLPFNISGHFGDVFRGRHPKYGVLALKRLRMGLEDDDTENIRRFAREGETWQKLIHPNVLPFLGTDSLGEGIYLISPFAQHGTVVDYLKRNPTSDRPKFLRDIAGALDFLHSNTVIHGDIKGRNVLVSPSLDAQVCDFGLARYADVSTSTNMKGTGTVRWSSPEVLCGQQKSYASDVYAFGMTIAEILSGESPFSQYKDNVAVITAVMLRNERPRRMPGTSAGGISYEREWDVAEQCWVTELDYRPSMDQVISQLSAPHQPIAIPQLFDVTSPMVTEFRKTLRSSQHIVVLAGAGLSIACGLDIQRDNYVSWRGYDVTSLISIEAFNLQPTLVWKFYYDRYRAAQYVSPNEAHRALASLAVGREIKRTDLPLKPLTSQEPSLMLIDDTIDGLLDRACTDLDIPKFHEGHSRAEAGFVIKMHGNVIPVRCSSCGGAATGPDLGEISRSWLSALEEARQLYESTGVEGGPWDNELPRCSRKRALTTWPVTTSADISGANTCMGVYRPDVVWFGEPIQNIGSIKRQLEECDLLVIAGTSSNSYPADMLVPKVTKRGGRVAVFNDIADAEENPDFLFVGPCVETISKALEFP